jgi:hypothetical protein
MFDYFIVILGSSDTWFSAQLLKELDSWLTGSISPYANDFENILFYEFSLYSCRMFYATSEELFWRVMMYRAFLVLIFIKIELLCTISINLLN